MSFPDTEEVICFARELIASSGRAAAASGPDGTMISGHSGQLRIVGGS